MALAQRRQLVGLCFAAAVAAGVSACVTGTPALVQLNEARRTVAELRLAFKKAADASNLAVMADTDEASIAFAAEAVEAKKIVQKNTEALAPLLRGLAYEEETQTLDEFIKRWAAYEAVDKTVLGLAVEKTNLKAQRLSFGAAREAANAFKSALEIVSKATPPAASCEVAGLIANAVIAVREIQVMYAQHIAEPADAVMDSMEKEMDAREVIARSAVSSLSGIADPGSKSQLTLAGAALDRFKATHTEIVGLSRKNSNVRSAMLSLGEKRTLASACEASLEMLSVALAKRVAGATR